MEKKKQQVLFEGIDPDYIEPEIKTVINDTIVHCKICNRILKSPDSKLKGMGEICEHKGEVKKVYRTNIQQLHLLD